MYRVGDQFRSKSGQNVFTIVSLNGIGFNIICSYELGWVSSDHKLNAIAKKFNVPQTFWGFNKMGPDYVFIRNVENGGVILYD